MTNLKAAKNIFSDKLKQKLSSKYKKQVSVTFFVNEFNLRANGTNVISYEAGRKWINGRSIPETSKLKVLADWLGDDLLDLFHAVQAEDLSNEHHKNSDNLHEILHSLFDDLNSKNQIAILINILVLKETQERDLELEYKKIIDTTDLKAILKELSHS